MFLYPLVLAAGGAAVAPVIIHLIMRTKPRRVVFPALRFVRKTHRAQARKLKLKHLILLAMRMAAIALIAVLLARAMLPAWRRAEIGSVPAAVAVVLDNSGSMNYRHRGRSLLAAAKGLAHRVVELLPAGSRVAVLASGNAAGETRFHTDPKLVGRQIAEVPAACGHEPVAPALGRAVALLAPVKMDRKELYLITDLTATSWREQVALAAADDIDFAILQVGQAEKTNMALGAPRLSASSVPKSAEAALTVSVTSARIGGEGVVRLVLDGQVVQQETAAVPAGGAATLRFTVQPPREGLVGGQIVLDHPDPLEMDNVRYFTIQVAAPPQVWIVRDPTAVGAGGQTSFLMANAVAPAGSESGVAQWARRSIITADRLGPEHLRTGRIIMLTDVSSIPASGWDRLEAFARGGGCVWVVLGPLSSPAAYNGPAAQQLLPATLKPLEELAAPMSWKVPDGRHRMVAPFVGADSPPLSEVRSYQRFGIGSVGADARAVIEYADGVPAVVSRPIGKGSALLWNASPIRSFSNLAQLPQFVVLVQRTVRLLTGAADVQSQYHYGQVIRLDSPRAFARPAVTVRPGADEPERFAQADPRTGAVELVADRLGNWTVEFAEGERREVRGFSVNADPAESDLTPADVSGIRAMFPSKRLAIASDPAEIVRERRFVSQPLDLTIPLLVVLLALLIAESFFANRFYRRTEEQTPAALVKQRPERTAS